jgi:hypothetical protein
MLNILVLALFASAAPAASPAQAEPAWKIFADCSAAHYADAQVPLPKRTLAQKSAVMDLGKRYSAEALSRRQAETHETKARTYAYTKSYILERTRLMALSPRPAVKALIDTCPELPE